MMYVLIGFVSGVISGMGLGGGTILMPLLTLLGGMPQIEAQCTNLLAYIPSASVALRTHARAGRIDGALVKRLMIWGILGMGIGVAVAFFVPADWLRRGFAIFLVVVGLWQFREGEKKHRERVREALAHDGGGDGRDR